jgi:purine-binding chemotaxis protein CheW
MADYVNAPKAGVDDGIKDLYLCFNIAGEQYAVEIKDVAEIKNDCAITPVPQTPVYVKGIINLRGDIAPVLDVRIRFGMEEKEFDDKSCVIIVRVNKQVIGLIVDAVIGSKNIPHNEISRVPTARLRAENRFVKNIGNTDAGTMLLLDLEKLLFGEER